MWRWNTLSIVSICFIDMNNIQLPSSNKSTPAPKIIKIKHATECHPYTLPGYNELIRGLGKAWFEHNTCWAKLTPETHIINYNSSQINPLHTDLWFAIHSLLGALTQFKTGLKLSISICTLDMKKSKYLIWIFLLHNNHFNMHIIEIEAERSIGSLAPWSLE